MAKLKPGQSLHGLSSSEWNRHVDTSDAYHRSKALGEPGGRIPLILPEATVKVQNLTGGDRAAGSVVELGEYLLTSFNRRHLWLEGLVPTAQGVPNIGVLIEAVPEDEMGPAMVAGVCLARVNVQNVADRFCYVQASSHVLKGGPIGHHRILDIPSNTGERTCVVALGSGVLSCLGEADGLIDTGDSGSVTILAGTPGSETTTGQTVPSCYNPGPPIYEGQQCTPAFLGGQLYVFPVECDP
jgi:hypothetical protein